MKLTFRMSAVDPCGVWSGFRYVFQSCLDDGRREGVCELTGMMFGAGWYVLWAAVFPIVLFHLGGGAALATIALAFAVAFRLTRD